VINPRVDFFREGKNMDRKEFHFKGVEIWHTVIWILILFEVMIFLIVLGIEKESVSDWFYSIVFTVVPVLILFIFG
jgi:hypothetical protein